MLGRRHLERERARTRLIAFQAASVAFGSDKDARVAWLRATYAAAAWPGDE